MTVAAVAAGLALFALGAAGMVALARWWRGEPAARIAWAYALLALLLLAPSLLRPGHQVATDIAYQALPFRHDLPADARRIVPRNPLLSDPLLQMLPFRTLVRQRLLRGEAPLWAHELGTGQPLLGNAQSAPFALLHLLALPLPSLRGMAVAAAWQALAALLLAHLLARRLGASANAAVIAALAWGLSLFMVVWLLYPMGMTVAWVPGVLLSLVLLRHGERGGFAGLVACVTAMALSGHPESLAHTALAAAGLVVVLLARRSAVSRVRFLVHGLVAAIASFLLAAPALLPVLDALPESGRRAEIRASPRAVWPPPAEPAHLAHLIHPLAFGSPRDGDWRGPSNFQETAPMYPGTAALVLAIAGAVTGQRRIALLLAAGLAALGASLGLPPFFDLLVALPEVGHGAHGRLRFLWVLLVGLAAALAADRLGRDAAGRRALLACLAIAAVGLLALGSPQPAAQLGWWLAAVAGLAGLAVAAAVPSWRPALPIVAAAALLVDLLALGWRYNAAQPGRLALAPPAAVTHLGELLGREETPGRAAALEWDYIPYLPALAGIADPRGYEPMRPAAATAWVRRRLSGRGALAGNALLSRAGLRDHAALSFLAVRYLLAPHRRELPAPWRPVATLTGGRLWRNPDALPLFFVPARVRPMEGGARFLAAAVQLPDPAREVVVAGGAAPARAQDGGVDAIRVEPDGYRLRVRSPSGALVASSVSFTDAWQVRAAGTRIEPVLVQGGFLGFAVPPGDHEVAVRYLPPGWRRGWILFALGAVGLAVGGLGGRVPPLAARRARARAPRPRAVRKAGRSGPAAARTASSAPP